MKEKIDIHNVTMISEGTTIEGSLRSNGNLRVDGNIFGNIAAIGMVTQGVKSEIRGNIEASSCIIGGRIDGNIVCQGKLSIEGKAVVNGDLMAKMLVVEEGALFNGRTEMHAEQQ